MTNIHTISDKVTKGSFPSYIEVLSLAYSSNIETYNNKYRQMVGILDTGSSLQDIYLLDNPILVYDDDPDTLDIFLWLAQETSKQKITNGIQLREITGLTSEPLDDMQNLFMSAMTFRLEITLECAIKSGLKYKDLHEINLEEYHLPDEWLDIDSDEFIDKIAIIKLAIASATGIAEHPKRRPSLQSVADALEAPYDLIKEIAEVYGVKE
ncbi:hypothetical protein ACFL5H_03325 [Candidatus Latescibacterota bacterium]